MKLIGYILLTYFVNRQTDTHTYTHTHKVIARNMAGFNKVVQRSMQNQCKQEAHWGLDALLGHLPDRNKLDLYLYVAYD